MEAVTAAPELLIESRSPWSVLFAPSTVMLVTVVPTVIARVPCRILLVAELKLAEACVAARARALTVIEWLPAAALEPAVAPTTASFELSAFLTRNREEVDSLSVAVFSAARLLLRSLKRASLLASALC